MQSSEARERVLDAAERLFAERGYRAVTIKDIAGAVHIHHSSLYYHIPGGKEQLYIEVTERSLQRHKAGLSKAIEGSEPDLGSQLQAIAAWLLSQPPMDLIRMTLSDMPAIDPAAAERLSDKAYSVLFEPIIEVLEHAQARGEVAHPNLGNVAGAIFSSIEGLHTIPDQYLEVSRQEMAAELIDVFIRGMHPL